ncbi:MAG: CapA family protein [Chloroflexi bacterium]|nr:CapA family protein [Chloroflexota bacterium]
MAGKGKGSSEISFYAAGDLCVNRDDPDSIFALVRPVLQEADLLFGQLETNISDRGVPAVHMGMPLRAPASTVSAYASAGFHVLSFASNHTLDYGNEALFDTIDNVKANGMEVIGVGRNIVEARRPAIVERQGAKIGFLAYNSVIPAGYDARPEKPGCAPVRISTFYEQVEFQPGTPARIITIPNRDDIAALEKDIRELRPKVDVLVVSMHWGLHFWPAMLAMYQRDVGKIAIDAGADLILGHHAHILKGVEVHKGKAIFYSLCNFAFDHSYERSARSPRVHELEELYSWKLDPDYPTYAFPADSRKTILVKCAIANGKIERLSYLPVMINRSGQPEILRQGDKRADEVFKYMEWVTEDQKLGAKFFYQGGEATLEL